MPKHFVWQLFHSMQDYEEITRKVLEEILREVVTQ